MENILEIVLQFAIFLLGFHSAKFGLHQIITAIRMVFPLTRWLKENGAVLSPVLNQRLCRPIITWSVLLPLIAVLVYFSDFPIYVLLVGYLLGLFISLKAYKLTASGIYDFLESYSEFIDTTPIADRLEDIPVAFVQRKKKN